MEGPKQPIKPKLTKGAGSAPYKDLKLNMTQHGFNTDLDAMAVYYKEEDREEKHRVIANDKGQCTDAYIGRVLDFGPLANWFDRKTETSKFVWVMDDCGNLYVDFHDRVAGIFHSSMMGGFRPIGAGEIAIFQGFIVLLNEESGHYAPQGRLGKVIEILTGQGFKFPKITLKDSAHKDKLARVTKQIVRDKLVNTQKLASSLKAEGTPK